MDQVKIGQFIAHLRREMNITQRELAERLSVSDKTVSKWECGNGLPEVSLMLPLCKVLGITVNELLSGERLESADYKAHAEENMTALLLERTENKRKLFVEIAVVLLTMLGGITLIMSAGLLEIGTPIRIALILIGCTVMFGGVFIAAYLEMTSGYFECAKCGEYFIPTKTAYLMAMHSATRRHLRCPHCGKKSWCHRRLSRKIEYK